MTLDEAFERYPDDIELKRNSSLFNIGYDIKFLKQHKFWADPELKKLGFIIPDFMIGDANADDWEVYVEDNIGRGRER